MVMTGVPVQAQTEIQPNGGIPLPSGVTSDHTEATRCFLSFRPNPVGVNQIVLVNMWLNPALDNSRYHRDYKVTITDPDGNEEVKTIDSYQGDATAWFEFTPDQVGEWTLKFEFFGNYFPAGRYLSPRTGRYTTFPQSTYYEPSSSEEQTLTVQEDMVYSWPDLGLPTDYWERPASLEHREWWPILGGWPGTGYAGGGSIWDQYYPDTNPCYSPQYDFHPWVQGPNTSHIVWKEQQDVTTGIIGGYAYHYGATAGRGAMTTPDLIYNGKCYDTKTVSIDGVPTSCAVCYDLRTGEMWYAIPTADGGVTPNIISYNPPGAGSVPGAEAQTTWSVELLLLSGSTLTKVNANTGAATEYDISPLSSSNSIYYTNQEVMSIQDLGDGNYRLIKWSTAGSSRSIDSRVLSNETYARGSFTSTVWEDEDEVKYRWCFSPLIDFNTGYAATVGGMGYEGPTRVYAHMRIEGYDLETGESLWNLITDEPLYSRSVYVADHGKIAVLTQGGYFLAYDLETGNLAWKSEQMDYPWAAAGFGAYAIQSAYGMIFRQAYDGVYAFNWDDGTIAWHYQAPSLAVYESPYVNEDGSGVYPFNGGAMIADGKMYVYNTEHTSSWPMTRGWGLHCIDIFTGELVWKIGNPMSYGAVADGYLTAANSWDGYQYVFGKGKTETTVTAPDVAVSKGTAITIKGTVLDMSPAQPSTPCVSVDSMSLQMEYLHLQRPIGGIWENETITGVPVILTAMAEDGSYVDIGTATTNGYYGTFGVEWTPPDEGKYEILAVFAGDDSYGSSGATTYVTVGPTPEEVDLTPVEGSVSTVEESISSLTTYVIVILVVVIIALVIALYSAFKPRK
jgi:hypothetical protein